MRVPPTNPEALRLRHRRLGLAWDFVKPRRSTRTCLPDSSVEAFRKLSNFVLGSSVAGLTSGDGRTPTWSLVLGYELELRKLAYRYVRDGEAPCLATALAKAISAPEALTTHFVIPFTLGKFETAASDVSGKGEGKGKGSQAGRDTLKFNKIGGCKTKGCKFAHICKRSPVQAQTRWNGGSRWGVTRSCASRSPAAFQRGRCAAKGC